MSRYDLDRQRILLRLTTRPILKPLAQWHRLTRLLSDRLVLILGSQRSGTTLMFLMLTSHPRITGLDESHARPICQAANLLPPWPVIAANAVANKLTVYKLPVSSVRMPDITAGYPHSHLVWMVRHPFAVVASMRNLVFPDGQTWLDKFALQQARATLAITAPQQIASLDHLNPLALGAMIWKHRLLLLEKYRDANMAVHPVRYEELVTAPELALQKLLSALDLTWSEQVLAHHQYHRAGQYAGFTEASRPLDQNGLGRGEELTELEKHQIREIASDLMARYSYL